MSTIGNDLRNGPRLPVAGRPAVRDQECVRALSLTMGRSDESNHAERVFSAGHAM